jgi:oligopeptide/dipeptide ABC transporter ATP-binding protein
VPIPDPLVEERRRPVVLAGDVPSPASPPPGCHFHTRCPAAQDGLCDVDDPVLREIKPGHFAACHLVTATDYPKIRSAEDRAAAAGTAAAGHTGPTGDLT